MSATRRASRATLGPYLGWGVGLVDIDNDGLLDLFMANGHVYPDVDSTDSARATTSASSCS